MNSSNVLMLLNDKGLLPFKQDGKWIVVCKDGTKTFESASDAMEYAKGLIK